MVSQSRVVEPVEGWAAFSEHSCWGEHADLIEDWFDAGEELQHMDLQDLEIDEPDRWERALNWVLMLFEANRGTA